MKKIYILIFVSAFLASCENALNIEQPGILVADKAIESVSDYNAALLGVYNRLDHTREILFNSVFTDELSIGYVNGGQNISLYSHILTPNSGLSFNLFSNYYITINQVNKLLKAGENLNVKSDELINLNNIKGQLLAIRAYAHFQLQCYFSTDLTDDNSLGVIKLDWIPQSPTIEVPRSKNSVIFDFIESDLNTANSLLKNDFNRIFISKDFITALRARMAAYRGKYSLAEKLTSQLLAKYSLPGRTQFFEMFDDTNDTGVIFELERTVGDSFARQGIGGGGFVGSLFAFKGSDMDGAPFMELSRSLFNLFDEDDIRKSRLIDPSSKVDPTYATNPNFKNDDILIIRKYPGHENQPLMNDLKIFRISEMLLLKAEAKIAQNDLSGAAILIKQLQDARYSSPQPLPVFISKTDAFDLLLKERRKELALEGFRWLDIKRLGKEAGSTINRDPVDCNLYNACNLENTDHRFTLPIPLREIDLNSLLSQNQGY